MPRADLEAAAAAGLISAEQIAPLDAFLEQRKTAPAAAPGVMTALNEEEPLRFIRNFHDVFLATGIILLAIGMAVAAMTIAQDPQGQKTAGWSGWTAAVLCAVSAAVLWILAEIFARRRRLFLPSIALCVTFAGYCAAACGFAYAASHWSVAYEFDKSPSQYLDFDTRVNMVVAAVAGLAAALTFYWRFRLPFSLGFAGTLSLIVLLALVHLVAPGAVSSLFPFILLFGGAGLFAFGLWFDTRDPERATRLSDNGFWLHLAAAPMILNGALGLMGRAFSLSTERTGAFGMVSVGEPAFAAVTLLIVALLGFLSLMINRRALIVSALLTTGIAVGVLMNAVGLGAGVLAATTLIVLGGGVLILGASWHKIRRALLVQIQPQGVWARVFPPESYE